MLPGEWRKYMDYSVRITKLEDETKSTKALASVTFNGEFKINNIAIAEAVNGYIYVNMPRYKSSQANEDGQPDYKDICMPVTSDFAKQFYKDIISVYKDAKENGSKSVVKDFKGASEPVEMSISVKAIPLKEEGGSVVSVASVCLEDCFVVRGIKVVKGSNGEFVSMPNYKTNQFNENGAPVYKDICHPVTADFRQKLFDAVLKESNIALGREQPNVAEEVNQPKRHAR